MSKILFLQNDWLEHLGPLYLSAFLKEKGIDSYILITRSPQKLVKKLNQLKPDLLAISLASAGHSFVLNLIQKAKPYLNIPIVIGGPHPTFFPEVLAHPAVDFIIKGEAEQSLYLLAKALQGKEEIKNVPGLGYKENGKLKFNPLAVLIEDLDQLPFPNRALYFDYGFYRRLKMRRVITSRGCPYKCRYCYNAQLQELYKGLGKYLRQRSAQNVIAELKSIAPITKTINIVDDSFGLNKEFRDEFLPRYPKEVGLPFIVNLRPEQVDFEFAQKLARAGCYCAQVGIETGNDELREQLLGRKIKKDQIQRAVRYLKELGIKVLSYNMLGLPGETIEQGFETIKLNQELNIDFPRFSLFQPYPGTEIAEVLVQKGMLNREQLLKNLSASYFHKSPLLSPEIKALSNLQKIYALAIKLPKLEKFSKKLIHLKPNPGFDLIFLISIALQYQKATNHTLPETIELGFRNLALYFE